MVVVVVGGHAPCPANYHHLDRLVVAVVVVVAGVVWWWW